MIMYNISADVIWFPRILVAGELRPNSYKSDGDDGMELSR